MTEYVGVAGFHSTAGIKKHLLLFDRLAIPIPSYQELIDPSFRADMEWLRNKGIVFEPPAIPWSRDAYPFPCSPEQMRNAIGPNPDDAIDPNISPDLRKKMESNQDHDTKLIDFLCRLRAVQLSNRKVRAVSVFPPNPEISKVIAAKGEVGDVLRIVLPNIQRPSGTTSLEEIIRFRDDSKTRSQMVRFRHWLNEMATKGVSGNGLVEELEYLTNEYEEHMRFHKLKTSTGVIEIFVTTSAEIAEDLLKLKLGKLAKRLFSLEHQRLELMEAELKAPGREIAYVVSAKNAFGNR